MPHSAQSIFLLDTQGVQFNEKTEGRKSLETVPLKQPDKIVCINNRSIKYIITHKNLQRTNARAESITVPV
jgi:hypothetical protein